MKAKRVSSILLLLLVTALMIENYGDFLDTAEFAICHVIPLEKSRLSSKEYNSYLKGLPKPQTGSLLLLGDSLTHHLGSVGVFETNLGVKGDTTAGLLARVDAIQTEHPLALVMIGVNDLRYRSNRSIIKNMELLAKNLTRTRKIGRVTFQSILPVHESRRIANLRIISLNQGISGICEDYGLEFIDLHSYYLNELGTGINNDLTTDGTHLSRAGNDLWVSLIHGYLGGI